MDALNALAERLERLRPLSAEQIEMLFPRWRAEDAPFVYATNAIEGSTLTLGGTIAVLQDRITIGGKPLRDHIDAVNGRAAYELMLSLAKDLLGSDDREAAGRALNAMLGMQKLDIPALEAAARGDCTSLP